MLAEALSHYPKILAECAVAERLRRLPGVELHPTLFNTPHIYGPAAAREAMASIYREYIQVACTADLPLLLTAPTWRLDADRVAAAGVPGSINADAVEQVRRCRLAGLFQARGVVREGIFEPAVLQRVSRQPEPGTPTAGQGGNPVERPQPALVSIALPVDRRVPFQAVVLVRIEFKGAPEGLDRLLPAAERVLRLGEIGEHDAILPVPGDVIGEELRGEGGAVRLQVNDRQQDRATRRVRVDPVQLHRRILHLAEEAVPQGADDQAGEFLGVLARLAEAGTQDADDPVLAGDLHLAAVAVEDSDHGRLSGPVGEGIIRGAPANRGGLSAAKALLEQIHAG